MATIHDVARAAGVSIATVSRSLNGQARVSEQTRRRVLDIAHDLDFLPNRAARGLVTGRLGNVGVLVPDLTNPFYAPLVAGIEQVAQTLDMGVFLADSRERQLAEQTLIRRLNQQVDGLILMASRLPDEAVVSLTTALPTVLVNRAVPGISSVGVDARRGMAQILEHLAELGHSQVAYVDGPPTSSLGRSKLSGLTETAGELGVQLQVVGSYAPTFAAGRQAAQAVGDSEATAVVAFNDLLAWGLITRLSESGLRIPEDLSVAGFDDAIEEGMLRPALTTVSPQSGAVGRRAMHLLTQLISEGTDDGPAVEYLSCIARFRESTAPPAR